MQEIAGDLEAVMQAWAEAIEARDAGAVAALFVEDGILLSDDAPTARGRAEIAGVVQSWIDAGETNDRTTTLAVFGDAHRATIARSYAVDFLEDGEPVTERGRYVASFRREDDTWRIEAFAIFVDPE